jgi:hypothetical protein
VVLAPEETIFVGRDAPLLCPSFFGAPFQGIRLLS